MKYVWTAEKKARLNELLESGMTYQKIADEFGMPLSSIWMTLRRSEAKQPRSRRWTKQDDERLVEMHKSGMNIAAIARELGANEMTARKHANELEEAGRIELKRHKKWTPELEGELIELANEGISYADIAKRLGMSYSAIINHAMKLVDAGAIKRRRAPIKTWTIKQEMKLIELYNSGMKYSAPIASELGMDVKRVACKISRLKEAGKL